jgi:hypothetical protein
VRHGASRRKAFGLDIGEKLELAKETTRHALNKIGVISTVLIGFVLHFFLLDRIIAT